MGASATLSPPALTVEPGARAICTVRVRNTGNVVDEVHLEVLGDAGSWATVEPSTLSLFPGTDGTATVTFAPPRSAGVQAGAVAFAVRVTPREDPHGMTVEEGTVEVLPFTELGAEMVPRTARGSRRGRFELSIDNHGNQPDILTLQGLDQDLRLRYSFDPPTITAAPGTATLVKVTVTPKKRIRTGAAESHQFTVVGQTRSGSPPTVDAIYLQQPTVPPWVPKALLAVAALAILLVALWFAVLKPTVRSAAKDAVKGQLDQQQAELNNVAKKLGVSTGGGGAGSGGGATGSGAGAGAGGGAGGGSGAAGALSILGNPADGRISVSATAHNAPPVTNQFTVPSGKTLSITDVVLENAQGDAGTLVLRRNDAVLLSVQLANFRDLDYHFVAPLVFTAGQDVTIALSCDTPGAPASACNDAIFYAGYIL